MASKRRFGSLRRSASAYCRLLCYRECQQRHASEQPLVEMTNFIHQDFTTVVANNFKELLDLSDEACDSQREPRSVQRYVIHVPTWKTGTASSIWPK